MAFDIENPAARGYRFILIILFQHTLLPLCQHKPITVKQSTPDKYHHIRAVLQFNMAEEFIDGLPRIPQNELSEDSSCMICFRKYGTDSADIAVRLPCNHHVGLE